MATGDYETFSFRPTTCTMSFDSCGSESAEDRVKRLKAEYDEVLTDKQEVEKQLREAQAKLAAEQAEKNKTYGQKVAKRDIDAAAFGGDCVCFGTNSFRIAPLDSQRGLVERLRAHYSTALDKAYADGAAEQRKKIAAGCRQFQKNNQTSCISGAEDRSFAYGYVAKLAEGSDFNI